MALLLFAIDAPPDADDFSDSGTSCSFIAFARAPRSGAWKGFSVLGGFPVKELLQCIHADLSAVTIDRGAKQT